MEGTGHFQGYSLARRYGMRPGWLGSKTSRQAVSYGFGAFCEDAVMLS